MINFHSLELNKTEIAASLHCVSDTVAATLQRTGNCDLQCPLPDETPDRKIAEMLFQMSRGKSVYKMPDYAFVHREM